jgi:UDP-N-acetyl-D-galactosamine dehydrogenase
MDKSKFNIAVIGLGYVGCPLAINFGKYYRTVGFDINPSRIKELKAGYDATNELSKDEIKSASMITFSSKVADIKSANIYIITVPTPINKFREPDLSLIFKASEMVGKYLEKDDIVVYESTVYPGCTQDDCVPILENFSKLKYNEEFFCGYSPERIVPGDKERTLTKIKKIVSASNKKTLSILDNLYSSIIDAGTYIASSIEVAEAAKVIENSQRDINIAFINELALIFDKMDINTQEVIDAASTKWNFLPFKPGLVGGHCIGVDPYYLAHKSASYGYHPKLILAGREINDNMSNFVAKKVLREMTQNGINIEGSNILILGITFKENCPDIRNTKIIDVIEIFKQFKCNIEVFDPIADKLEVETQMGIKLINIEKLKHEYDCILELVCHNEFIDLDYSSYKKDNNSIIFKLRGGNKKNDYISL